MDLDRSSRFGWKILWSLQKVGFVPDGPDAVFDFLDPVQAICGVHIIPSFLEGLTGDLLEPSFARLEHKGIFVWRCYYVNM